MKCEICGKEINENPIIYINGIPLCIFCEQREALLKLKKIDEAKEKSKDSKLKF